MSGKLDKIKGQIEALGLGHSSALSDLEAKAREAFKAKMKTKRSAKVVAAMVDEVNNSRDLTRVEHDEYYHQFSRADFGLLIDDSEIEKDLLREWFRDEHCIDVDFENDCISSSIGPAILVLDDGGVYDQDSGKVIIKKDDYEDETDLKRQIELHMNEMGYFPSVLKVGYHGNAEYYDTRPEGLRKIIQDAAKLYNAEVEK